MAPPAPASAAARAIAWLGGALFVGALLTGVWWFGWRLGSPGPAGRTLAPAVAWNVLLFSLFALHHSLLARPAARAWIMGLVPAGLERSAYVWVASLLFLAVGLGWRRVPGVVYAVEGPARWAFGLVQLAGVSLTLAGARVLDGLDLAGIRQVTRPPRPAAIRVVWPFTLVRHPIYLGWVLMVGAATPMTVDRAVFAAVSTLYLVIAIPWEERSLSAAAGPAYSAYCRRVRWRLVPGLY